MKLEPASYLPPQKIKHNGSILMNQKEKGTLNFEPHPKTSI